MNDLPKSHLRVVNAQQIPIDTDVPLPKPRGQANPVVADIYATAKALAVGHSFKVLSVHVPKALVGNLAKKFGGKFIQRKYKSGVDAGYTRIWKEE